MKNVIARRELIFRKEDGDELVTEIQIGAPYKRGVWEWACEELLFMASIVSRRLFLGSMS